MTRHVVRMAVASTWRSSGSDRLRCVTVAVATAILAVVTVGALSTWNSSERINERVSARNFMLAADDGSDAVAYERTVSYDEAPGGGGILVAQWRIHPDNPPLPGIPADATGWYVSPGLAEVIAGSPALQMSYPKAEAIGRDGVGRADELVAFEMLPQVGDPLSEQMTSVPFDYFGDGAELDLLPISIVLVALLGIPGVSLLKAAIGVSSPKRERTAQLLFTLGAPKRSVRTYAFLTGFLAAVPGAVLGVATWALAAPQLTSIPIVGRPVLSGDLSVNLAAAFGLAIFIAGIAGIVARVAVQPIRSGDVHPQRPRRWHLPGAAWGVFGVSTCMLAAVMSGGIRPRLFLIGIVALIVGLPALMRALLAAFGTALSTRLPNRPVALITGRVLSSDSKRITRPLVAMMAVITVLPVLMSWVGVARTVDPPTMSNGAYTFVVTGAGSNEVAADYANQTGQSVVAVDYNDSTGEADTAVITHCDALAGLFAGASCDGATATFNPARGVVPRLGLESAALSAPVGFEPDVQLIYTTDLDSTDAVLRTSVAEHSEVALTVPDQRSESPLVAWILGVAAITLTLSGLGLVVALIAQATQAARQRTRLAALGTPRGFIQQLSATESGVAVTAAASISLTAGLFLVVIFKRIEPVAHFPIAGSAVIMAASLGIAFIVAASAALTVGQPGTVWNERSHTGW